MGCSIGGERNIGSYFDDVPVWLKKVAADEMWLAGKATLETCVTRDELAWRIV